MSLWPTSPSCNPDSKAQEASLAPHPKPLGLLPCEPVLLPKKAQEQKYFLSLACEGFPWRACYHSFLALAGGRLHEESSREITVQNSPAQKRSNFSQAEYKLAKEGWPCWKPLVSGNGMGRQGKDWGTCAQAQHHPSLLSWKSPVFSGPATPHQDRAIHVGLDEWRPPPTVRNVFSITAQPTTQHVSLLPALHSEGLHSSIYHAVLFF